MEQKKVYKQVQTNIVDLETGEIKQSKDVETSYVNREPDFIKLYIADLIKLNDMPKSTSNILLSLLRNMTYDNEIIIIASLKRKIAKELNIAVETINKAVQRLNKQGIISRKDTSLYAVNPYLFGRGKWQDIKELRLKVTYNKDGKFITTEVDKQQEFDF